MVPRVLLPELLGAAPALLFRGTGRSDAGQPAGASDVVSTVRANRVLRFDPATGLLRAEAGLTLAALIDTFLPRGWFVPVVPGTAQVTLGGMVAVDAHGLNHRAAGTFGAHVHRLLLRVPDGRLVECGPDLERELFLSTVGGLGLTGQILEVELPLQRVPTPWVMRQLERCPDLSACLDALDAAKEPFTEAWVDGTARGSALGRGVLLRARWAQAHEAPASFPAPPRPVLVPLTLPEALVSRGAVRWFNAAFHATRGPEEARPVDPFRVLFPLDHLHGWERAGGHRGFTQYQCVLPRAAGRDAAHRFLDVLSGHPLASTRCVLRALGEEGPAMLSFPRPGLSFALELPLRDTTASLVDALNEVVLAAGGRVYLAKDTLTRAAHLRAMEPRLPAFEAVRDRWDPHHTFKSHLSVRLLGD